MPTHRTGINLAVVGATGLVGRTMLRVLEERGVPHASLRLMASQHSVGQVILIGDDRIIVEDALEASFEGVDIALFAVSSELSRELAPRACDAGAVVIDNSNAWRMEPEVPLVAAGVNDEDVRDHSGIIANPNCSTMQLAPVLAALRDAAGLERVIVDTYQAVAGTGMKAIDELEDQVRAHIAGESLEALVYPRIIAFNAIPSIDVFLPDGYTKEERKIIEESRKILHLPELRVSATAVRVPVLVGHSEAVHVELTRPLSAEDARVLFAATPGVVVEDDPDQQRYPLARTAAGRDEVFVGRIRQDESIADGRGLALWVVADNLRKGAATNAIDLVEILLARGLAASGQLAAESLDSTTPGGDVVSRPGVE